MKRFCRSDIHRILTSPLDKKIDQPTVEKWSASFWDQLNKRNNDQLRLSDHCHETNNDYYVEPFVMMLPPPNITGNLHLGHALTVAIQDALIRQRRMLGKRTVWIPGFDHAGIGTQNIVEKLLWNKHHITRQEYGREKFVNLAHSWKDMKRDEMKEQIDRLGLFLNYEQEYFTLDEKSSLAVRDAFKLLFKNGLIYRTVKPVFWSQKMQTTLSDIEVEKDLNGYNRYVRTGEIVDRKDLSQWFLNCKDMAERAVKVVQDGSIKMLPENYKQSWSSWLLENGVQDWCISRQNWWGHRIPAFKLQSSQDSTENWIVADNLDEAKMKFDITHARNDDDQTVVQDQDVLDTWFSSSLLPLTISGWPDLEKFQINKDLGLFPLTIMETGFDILTYWVSKMTMMSLALTNEIPFKLVLLHGMICDSNGKKMSKSKGNVIDPLDVIDGASLENLQHRTRVANEQGIIEDSQLDFVLKNQEKLFPKGIPKCGADGLRAYLLSHDFQEEVVKVQIMQIDKIRRLSNKIWNIFRFVINILDNDKALTEKIDLDTKLDKSKLDSQDIELFRDLCDCVKIANDSFNNSYHFHYCFNKLELFWTQSLSINFIANNKHILIDKTNSNQKVKLLILIKSIITATKILHPYMPHLTEFLYQRLSISCHKNSKLNLIDINDNEKILDNMKSLSNENFPLVEEWLEYLNNNEE